MPGPPRRRPAASGALPAVAAVVGLMALGFLGAGCRPGAGARDYRLVGSPAVQPIAETFALERLARAREVARWSGEELLELCREVDSDGTDAPVGPAHGARKIRLRCSLPPAPAGFERLEIEFRDANRTGLRLSTSPSGTRPSGDGWLDLPEPQRVEGRSTFYRSPAIESPESVGPRDLWIEATTRSGGAIQLQGLTLAALESDPERLAAAVQTPWLFRQPDEWRAGFPALAGHPLIWRTAIPEAAQLRFAFLGGGLAGETFAVKYVRSGLGERLLYSGVAEQRAWRSAEVDLSGLAGGDGELRFEVAANGDGRLTSGIWSVPALFAPSPPVARPHILLISIDTLRADHLTLHGFARPTSPRIDRWARARGVVFDDAMAQAPWTLPSHVSILTGLDPLHHGVNLGAAAPRYRALDNLALQLSRHGYRTDAVTGGGFVHPSFGFAFGFDRYRFWPADRDPHAELAAGVDQVLQLFDEDPSSPRFVFLHTYEVHPPNRGHEPYFSRMSSLRADLEVVGRPGEPTKDNGFIGQPSLGVRSSENSPIEDVPADLAQLPADVYDSSIAYMDSEIGRLLDGLEDRGLGGRTLVVITSDHGESLGEAGRWSHGHLDRPNLHVPLIVAFPDRRGAGTRVAGLVRTIDILPTLLDLLGIAPRSPVDGESLLTLIGDTFAGHAPREGWAYGSSNNRGLLLRTSAGKLFLFQDSAYPPVLGQAARLDPDWNPLVARQPADIAQVEEFRRAVRRRWEGSAPGLVVTFTNSAREPFSGFLRSELIDGTTVKSWDVPAGGWKFAGRGQGRFTVPPQTRFSILLQDRGRREESVAGELEIDGCRTALPFDLTLSDGVERELEIVPGKCAVAPSHVVPPLQSVVFAHRGSGSVSAAPATAADGVLLEQLRALGYN